MKVESKPPSPVFIYEITEELLDLKSMTLEWPLVVQKNLASEGFKEVMVAKFAWPQLASKVDSSVPSVDEPCKGRSCVTEEPLSEGNVDFKAGLVPPL